MYIGVFNRTKKKANISDPRFCGAKVNDAYTRDKETKISITGELSSHNWHRPSVSLQFIASSRRLIGTFNQSDFSDT